MTSVKSELGEETISSRRDLVVILAIVFFFEAGLMFLLPMVVPAGTPIAVIALVDALLLTGGLAAALLLPVARSMWKRSESEYARLYRAVEQSPATVVITDCTGRIEYVNPKFTDLTGYTREEAIGQNPRVLKSGKMPPEIYEDLWATISSGKDWHGELLNRKKNGELFWESATISPVTNRNGEITHFVAVKEDITGRKRTERQLTTAKRQAEEAHVETSQLLEAISSVLVGTDVDRRVKAWNGAAERAFGIERENALGRRLKDLRIGWDYTTIVMSMAVCHAEKRSVRVDEMRFKRPNGTEGFLGMTVNPVCTDSQTDLGYLIVAADITEHKILQGQLIQAQKLESVGQLAAGIAHEINTPTQYIGDNTRFLQDTVQDLFKIVDRYASLLDPNRGPQSWGERAAEIKDALEELDIEFLKEEIPKAIEQTLEGVERVATIVRAMKQFSHPGGEEKSLVNLSEAIETTVTVARNEWKYVAEVVTEFDSDLPDVSCLPAELNQVLLNLLVNAAQAIGGMLGDDGSERGTITVGTRRDGEWAEIFVRDTGPGIPEDIRARVFDPFFTTKEVGKGTGQGLAIARSVIVEQHDGTIDCQSEPGQGTTFTIRLPINGEGDTQEATNGYEEACLVC